MLSLVNKALKSRMLTTKHYQRATNHQGYEQVLEKRNRLEQLEDDGYQRSKQVQIVAFVVKRNVAVPNYENCAHFENEKCCCRDLAN